MKEELAKHVQQDIAWNISCLLSWLNEIHNINLSISKLTNIIKKLLKVNQFKHTEKDIYFIGLYARAGVLNEQRVLELRKQYFDFHVNEFMQRNNISINSLKGSTKKQKKKPSIKNKKNSLIKNDWKSFIHTYAFYKISKNKILLYEDGTKPTEVWKNNKKLPKSKWNVQIEKFSKNKWMGYLFKLNKKKEREYLVVTSHGKTINVVTGYCKTFENALNSLNKILNNL